MTLLTFEIERLPLEQLIETYEMSVFNASSLNKMRREQEPYPAFTVSSEHWGNRETAAGATVREAVLNLLKKKNVT